MNHESMELRLPHLSATLVSCSHIRMNSESEFQIFEPIAIRLVKLEI